MRIVPSLLIALALVFGVSAATTLTASADRKDEAKKAADKAEAEADKDAREAKAKTEAEARKAEQKAKADAQKAKAEATKAEQKAKADARKAEQKAKADARKAEQKARADAAKAAQKKRLHKQEDQRHAARMKEIEGRRARVIELHEKQLRNIAGAEDREKARHENRGKQIDAR
jgi:hypothetical protein